jgi:hypothetical protein
MKQREGNIGITTGAVRERHRHQQRRTEFRMQLAILRAVRAGKHGEIQIAGPATTRWPVPAHRRPASRSSVSLSNLLIDEEPVKSKK